jgi:ferredoxin
LGIELAFMSHLAAREALAWDCGNDDEAWSYLARQESFLHDHLLGWLPQFCRRLLAGRPHAYYAELAQRVETLVVDDAAWVRTWLGHSAEVPEAAATRRESWAVTLDGRCTLCDICVQVCRVGALQLLRSAERGTVTLLFEADLCDGCSACQRWCPEMIINVSRLVDGEGLTSGELARSKMLACPRCGQLHAPAAMVTKVQEQMGHGSRALLQRLALCHDCKARGPGL